ncbi:von Hippel-Lindau disease tumor suppressor-like [Plakobranchus ocellatus]|uniref:von Hippel-Lindau disease tumor suppressor-like n=1 Tax=Plakobranchus ocellatus TaxID=259542 RepID=A0AAV3ZM29_9GAST|nr:von Hippel-Lindau disease tumor suppressor-like [Plakobranchus ocellatus]
MSNKHEEEPRIKSLHSNQPAYLTFINRTGNPVDIAWLDYRGNIVRYRHKLGSGGICHQDTYFTHPWIAWHSYTLERATFCGKKFYLPEPYKGGRHRTVVYIDRPVKSLLQLCLQAVKNLVRAEDVDQLEIPKDLQDPLKNRRRIDFVDEIVYRR